MNDFIEWMRLKIFLDELDEYKGFKEGEVWWAALGKNVGVEINGKSENYSRPVVILRKLSVRGLLAIPLTSQVHEGSWYVDFVFQDKKHYAVLSQIRTISAKRLYNRIGKMSKYDYSRVKQGFIDLLQ